MRREDGDLLLEDEMWGGMLLLIKMDVDRVRRKGDRNID